MHVAIVIYSKTGMTFRIAQKIALHLNDSKINCDVIRLESKDELRPRLKTVSISTRVNLDNYDTIIFGTPVWAFTAAPVVPAFLKSKPDLKGKKVLNYITMGLPFKFMGGNSAQTLIDLLASSCGATVINKGGIINQFSMHNATKTDAFVKSLVDKFKNSY